MVNTWAGDSRQWKILWLWLHAGSESDLRECGSVTITKIRIMRIGVLCVATLMYARVETFYANATPKSPGKILHIRIVFVGYSPLGSLLHWRQLMSMASYEIDPAWRNTFFESN